jgi:phospholipid/cholesterol/gamma-HCH transport system ATP-binding protein
MSAAGDIVIAVRHLAAGYGERQILREINFEVRRGEVFGIIGGSGCGKSTLLKHMIGLFPPLEGEVWIEGENLVSAQGEARSRLLGRFGVVYQSGALFGSMTVAENVRLPLEEFTDLPPVAREHVALAKLKVVGLAGATDRMPAELSGGMQKRAAIARALALDPRILFLDEPSAGLDPVTSAGLDALIRQLSRHFGITFVIVTHDLASINAITDRLIMLDARSGTILAEGSPAELRAPSAPEAAQRFFNRQAVPGATMSEVKFYGRENS